MKHLAVAKDSRWGRTTVAESDLVGVLAALEKCPGADRRGIARVECFT